MTSAQRSSRSIDRSGEVLESKYEIGARLGSGGMGAVYEATHNFVGRKFAVKFLHSDLADNPDIISRFRQEARAAGSLHAENIVAVTDFGAAADGAPYIVMEYLEGEDLRTLLARRPKLPVQRALNIVIQACHGLDAAHSRGIIHRDLKPDNLFVVKRGDGSDLIKLLDFGIAKLRANTGVKTATGTFLGTISYMPPEQVRGGKDTDHRSDIYALGCILYEALAGEVPHPGEEAHNVLFHLMHEQPIPLERARQEVSPELAAVVHRAIAFEAEDRYQHVLDFASALEPFRGNNLALFRSVAPSPGESEPQTQRRPLPKLNVPQLPPLLLKPTLQSGNGAPPTADAAGAVAAPVANASERAPTDVEDLSAFMISEIITPDARLEALDDILTDFSTNVGVMGTSAPSAPQRHADAVARGTGASDGDAAPPPTRRDVVTPRPTPRQVEEARRASPVDSVPAHRRHEPSRSALGGGALGRGALGRGAPAAPAAVRPTSLRQRLEEPQVALSVLALIFALGVLGSFAVNEVLARDDAPPPPILPAVVIPEIPAPADVEYTRDFPTSVPPAPSAAAAMGSRTPGARATAMRTAAKQPTLAPGAAKPATKPVASPSATAPATSD